MLLRPEDVFGTQVQDSTSAHIPGLASGLECVRQFDTNILKHLAVMSAH